MSSEEKLKPCFCGKMPKLSPPVNDPPDDFCSLHCWEVCCDCGWKGPGHEDVAEAIAAWNIGVAVPSVSCEKLEALADYWQKREDIAPSPARRQVLEAVRDLIEESRRGA